MPTTATGTPGAARRRRRVTIDDLASQLSLTKGTVSRALNGYPDISDQTRLRVRKAAETMGYRPLSHAQAIRTGRVRSVGLVLQINEHDGHRPFLADFLAGVSEAASGADWTMTLATAASDVDTARLLRRLADENKADGFILPRTYLNDPRIDLLRAEGIPFVLYGRTADPAGCAWYDIAGETAMQDAVVALHKLGHRRIGFVPGGAGYTYSELRLQGFRAGLAACGLAAADGPVSCPAVDYAQGAEATRALLALPCPPTALVFAVDRAALGAWEVAAAAGLQIGRDLSVIAYDGIPEGAFVSPGLSTYAVDSRAAGRRLTELLIRRIRGEAPETLREIAPARFLARGSHGAPARTPDQLARTLAAQPKPTGGTQ